MKKITVNKTRILTAAAALVAVFSLAGCGSNAVQEIPRAETSRSEEATPETAAPEAMATPAPTPEPTPAVVVPTSVTLEQEGGILNNGMTWTLHATVLPEDAADKTITWTSADESVATIDDSGVITTHAPGQTTITAASTAGGVSTTYNLVVQEVVKCSYCGGTGHTADTCAVKKTAEQQAAVAVQQQAAAQAAAAQAAEQPAAEAAQPADPGYAVTAKGDRIYPEGSPDIPEGGVVQRPDGTFYVKGPRNVIFGYEEGEPEDEPHKEPATPETPPEHAAEPAPVSVSAQPEPVPEPAAPAPQSTPEPQPVQASPDLQPEPQTKPIQKPGNRHHGSAPFPPNLPLRKMDETLLPCRVRPAAGLTLRTEDGDPITLRGALMEGDEEAKGGEGSLYLTDTPGQVAKIYNAEHLTAGRRDKLDEMLRHDPQIRGLCWPTHMLYTRKGDFIGYTMPQAPEGALPFSKSVLRIGSPSVREKLLKSWDRLDLVQAARSAAYIVAQLHRRNILMGDVNSGNFMVDPGNSANVYVVDTDSFQLGGFPCPVGVEDFTHPGTAQRLGVTGALKYDTFLRTPDEENYVLAIMIFKVLFLNQNPFVTKTKMTYREAMAAKKFSYALDGDDYEVPDGDNWMIWKNLPRKVSDAFTAAFTQWKCATAYEWVGLLDYYASSIRKYGFSRELAPMKYHEFRPDDPIYVDLVCPCCHKEFNIHKNRYAKLHDEFHTPIFCRNCNASLQQHGNEVLHDSLTCVKCGRKYDATFRENMYARAEPQKALCPNCRPRRTYYTRGR